MDFVDVYLDQNSKMAIDALRVGYYLIEKVTVDKSSKKPIAAAYWNPFEPDFSNCVVLHANLHSLKNYFSVGLKELSFEELNGKTIHIKGNELVDSQIPGYSKSYKIVWELAANYDGVVSPSLAVDIEVATKYENWQLSQEMKMEYNLANTLSYEEEEALGIETDAILAAQDLEDQSADDFYTSEDDEIGYLDKGSYNPED